MGSKQGRNLGWAVALAAAAMAAGCAGPRQLGAFDGDKAIATPVKPAVELTRPQPTLGSLFVASRADYLTDLRAHQVGDIVTVAIVENAKAKSKNDTKAERTTSFKAAVPYLLGHEGGIRRDGSDKKTDPILQADTTSSQDAKGELKREDTMTASIGCTVLEVLANGNLVIRGSREVEINGETQNIILQGVVRPSDIRSTNTVQSTQIADAKIWYTGRGVLSDKQRPGWLTQLLDSVWPF